MTDGASEPAPETCRAWTFSERGEPKDVLNFVDVPKPTLPPAVLPSDAPKPEEWVLIKTAFVGLNVGAIFQMTLIPKMIRRNTCVPEMDLSGEVEDVWHPAEANDPQKPFRFQKGDRVIAMLPASHSLGTGTGALSEYVCIPAKYVAHKPSGVTFADAAGCLLAGMTAAKQVEESGAKLGDRVLVNAASGGIGTLVVQMVRNIVGKDGHVVGICSGRNSELVKDLGADEVIDYTQQSNLPQYLVTTYGTKPFNTIIDTLGHQNIYTNSPKYLEQGGVYSSAGIKPPNFSVPNFLRAVWQMKLNEWWPVSTWLGGVGRLWRGVSMMEPSLQERENIVGMLGDKKVKIVRDSIWKFEEAKEAYIKLGGLHARGKVLVKVNAALADDAA
ncbi:Putative Zinc alcohol dehydrogenase [[Torrubiella] hemipterigena]|uniref:Putative Zinc alcohol dehydrogenase n=1 Tax=[Torrubiella] hemipterigena TaxID=1531966 RepID=A0A0A1T2V5_9HYPO|nr:Putative Zinc alcohol dehydrogenase [[Torrubiella] hemipterigena]